jgi:glucose-1-phosphate cytidylyltransferase
MSSIPLVILAGGLGTRLREETEFRPKPMVQIGGKPILWHIMKYYSCWGVNEFIICTGYKGEQIKNYFLNYQNISSDISINLRTGLSSVITSDSNEDWKVTVVDTGPLTPTGGRINKIKNYINSDTFFCTYGDGVANVDINSLLDLHTRSQSIATLTAVQPLSRFGVIDFGISGQVASFREKPRLDTWINGGYFVFNKGIFDYLSDDCSLEVEPLAKLASSGELSAFQHDGFWQPMDTLRESQFLNDKWNEGKAEWAIWLTPHED